MQIKINLQIFIIIVIFILTRQIEIYSWLMFFALLHEIGHLMVGIILGLKPKSLHIVPFGLTVVFETYESRKIVEIKKIAIAISRTDSKFVYNFDCYVCYFEFRAKGANYLFKYFNSCI